MFPVLETERLILRELTEYDSDAIFSVLSNPIVTKYYGKESYQAIDEAQKFISYFKQKYYDNRGIRWGIAIKEKEILIGTIGFDNWIPMQKRAEIGFELHPEYWKYGYATEAVNRILTYGFNKLGLTRIGAIVFPENVSSITLLNRVGFQKEGILRGYIFQNGISNDTYVYSILDKEFNRN